MGRGFVSKCKDARAGGSGRFGHSPRKPRSRNTFVIGETADNLLNFLSRFLGSRVRTEATRTTFLRWSIFLLHGASEVESKVGV